MIRPPGDALLLWAVVTLSACGVGMDNGRGDVRDQANGTDDPLARLAFTGGILQADSRLIGYSRKTGRLSIVDPLQPAEIWGASLPGYAFAVAHPDLRGASLFSNRLASVVDDQGGRRDFTLPFAFTHAASATQVVAYSLASGDGGQFTLLRFLGGGQWQQDTFTVPWADSLTAVGSPPASQPVLLATEFNADASLLLALAPADGRYALYQAAGSGSPLVFTGKVCPGNGRGSAAQAYFRSLEWDQDRQVFYLGDIHGVVYAVDPLAACVDWNSAPALALATDAPISRISVYGAGQLAVTQATGPLTLVDFDGEFSVGAGPYATGCLLPFGALPAGSDHLLVFCVAYDASGQQVAPAADGGNPNIDPARYLLLRRADGSLREYPIGYEPAAGIAVDSDNARLYRLFAGAFGRFERLDLLTGERRLDKGLFISHLLD